MANIASGSANSVEFGCATLALFLNGLSTRTLATMLFGDDWENEMAGLKALRKDVNYLIGNGSGKIPEYLEVGRA